MRRVLEIALGLGLALFATSAASRAFQPAPAEVHSAEPAAGSAVPVAEPPPRAPSAIAPIGPRYDDDASLPQHAEEVASYTLRASLDPVKHTVHGEGTIVWRNTSATPQRELYLHLYLNAFKNERTIFLRIPAGGFRGGQSLTDWGHIEVTRLFAREMAAELWPTAERTTPADVEDETDIRVPLPREVAPKETITLDVVFDSHLPSVTLRTGYLGSFHMVAQWFPKLARLEPDGQWAHFPFHRFSEFYADFGAYDVTVDTPEAFVVGATGQLDKEVREGGRAIRRFVQRDVHDFAFTAWDRFETLAATSDDGVAIRCLYPPGYERAAAVEVDTVRYGLGYFGAAYGRYPYRTLTIVHPPSGAEEAGGMEYPTMITTGGPWFMPHIGVRQADVVSIHELGHQWFYGLVATNEHAWPFLDEGVNSYAEVDAMEARFPGVSLGRFLGLDFGLPAVYRASALRAEKTDIVARSAATFPRGSDYGSLVYARTATLLGTLAQVYGADVIRRAVGRYTRRYRFDHPGPEQLLTAVREVAGAEAAENLELGLFEGGWVGYSVEDVVSGAAASPQGIFGDPDKPSPPPAPRDAAAYHGQALVRRRGTLVFPVDIDFVDQDGGVQRVHWDGREPFTRAQYAGSAPLATVVVDPDHRILMDDDLSDNAQGVATRKGARRVLERATFYLEDLMLLVVP